MPDADLMSATVADTFCVYLARQLIAKRGFSPGSVPEAQRITTQSDIVLSFFDGVSMNIIAMIDREAHPGKGFTILIDELEEIGKACLKYSGRLNGARMPLMIRLIEVGPVSDDQPKRLSAIKRPSIFSKVVLSAWVIDTENRSVWTTAGFAGRSFRRFVSGLLLSPRQAIVARPDVAIAPSTFPVLTSAILAVLCAVFAAETIYGVGPPSRLLEPTIATLVALGGLTKALVLEHGQWYRLLSAPFLHVDVGHLALNGIALFIAGRTLESLVGRAWFGSIYVVGALCGSLTSLLVNPASVISVGASGAIMGLFAAMLVASLHFPVGMIRNRLQINAMYTLIPSLLPLASVLHGQRVDYGAHFGGAFGGAAVGLIMVALWPRSEPKPQWRKAAVTLSIAGVVALAFPLIAIIRAYPMMVFASQLIPPDRLPRTSTTTVQARELVARYPHDPRGHLFLATQLLRINDLGGAEREARVGLAEEDRWRELFNSSVSTNLRAVLAVAIVGKNRDEAVAIARPVCAAIKDGPQRALLDSQKLCGS